MNRLTSEIKNQIYELYVQQKLSIDKVHKILKLPYRLIRNYLEQKKYLRAPGEIFIIPCDDYFFNKINTEEKAYWLGYFYADGNMSKSTNNIVLSSIDLDTMVKFKKAIKYQGTIKIETHKVYKKQIYKIICTSKQLRRDLFNLGCTPKKSLTITFPSLPSEAIPHFIRGYFDGDGSVGVYKNSNKIKNCYTLRSEFCSGSYLFLEQLIQQLPIKNKKIKKDIRKKSLYRLNFSVNDSKKLYEYMYQNATIWLNRKKEKFDLYINRERRSTTIIGHPNKDEGIV